MTQQQCRFFTKVSTDNSNKMDELQLLAKRIAEQLSKHATKPGHSACLDDLLGAVYSLFYAARHGYEDRTSKSLSNEDMKHVIVRANDMAHGKVREDGKWTAGFYFNNALFRLAAIYHRELKLLTNTDSHKDDGLKKLVLQVHERYESKRETKWKNCNLEKIHLAINKLKHSPNGAYHGRDVTFDQAKGAVHELIDLLEVIG